MQSRFEELIAQVRTGDAAAAEEVVRLYAPQIQRVVRIRLTDPRLRRQMDSMDVCQSVMGEFFFRLTMGQFEIKSAEELVALLVTMARNKLLNRVKLHRAAKRDVGRDSPIDDDTPPLPAADSSPSVIVARRELLEACRKLLTDDELRLTEGRADGRSWEELGVEFRTTPEALRKRHARALSRVATELGLDDSLD